jgi:hypothetical protein
VTLPFAGVAALVAAVVWMARPRRRRVPGGPIIHRARLEAAEREVRAWPERPTDVGPVEWGPRTPRAPIHL